MRGLLALQVILTLGVVLAQIINIWTGRFQPWGWRVSLGLAGVPAIVLTLGGIFLPDTPNSLIERGFEEEGRKVRPSIDFCCSLFVYSTHPSPLGPCMHDKAGVSPHEDQFRVCDA